MKVSASILTLIWTLMLVQPSFTYFGGKSAYGNGGKATEIGYSCSKVKAKSTGCYKEGTENSGCPKKRDSSRQQERDGCSSNNCNPSLGCSSGNFYILQYFQISLSDWTIQKKMALITDDNRVIKSMSDCWRPPKT